MLSKFPAMVTATLTFAPEDAFGVHTVGVRTTAPKDRPAGVVWNANEGTVQWEVELIDRVNMTFNRGNFKASLDGNNLILTFNTPSLDHTSDIIASANHFLPALLTFHLKVFVWITKFEVNIGEANFNFEIPRYNASITVATKEYNTNQIITTLDEWLGADKQYLRILLALYYYRHAKRLANMEPNRESMVAEVLLNLTKAVEIIFSSNRECLRDRARKWGFSEIFIEKRIIPLFLIRNELDIAHVTTSPLDIDQRQVIINFTSAAILTVHELIERLSKLVKEKEIKLQPPSPHVEADKKKLLQTIAQYLNLAPEDL
ncbi:MAG: hypothetical protein WBC05_07690 [Sedimentisphaerales bacterium]